MRLFPARRFALAALVPALFLFSVVPGCSNEGEGQRCGDDLAVNDEDCADGLVCINASMLVNAGTANRCCNASPTIVHDSRCSRSSATGSATGGTGGSGGATAGGSGGATAGTGGSAGSSAAAAGTAGAVDTADAGAGGS